jgi:cytochrome c556
LKRRALIDFLERRRTGGRRIEPMRAMAGLAGRLNLAPMLALGLAVGCSAAPPEPSASGAATPDAAEPLPASSRPAVAASSAAKHPAPTDARHGSLVRVDAEGRKWLGDVPYDVFFDDPLAVAAEGGHATPATATTAGTAGAAGVERPISAPPAGEKPSDGPAPSTVSAAAAADESWKSVVDVDVLDAEIKRIRNELKAALKSNGTYGARFQEVSTLGGTAAAVGEIVLEHPGPVSWKKNATAVRDLGSRIHESSSAIGGKAYDATKNAFDELVDVLDGNASSSGAAARRDFSEVAGREAVMKRMDQSFQWLKKNGSSPQVFRKDRAQALHESSMLAAFCRVIVSGRYDSADDPKYKAHADELSKDAAGVLSAVRSANAGQLGEAVTRVQKRCDACHADFRFQ